MLKQPSIKQALNALFAKSSTKEPTPDTFELTDQPMNQPIESIAKQTSRQAVEPIELAEKQSDAQQSDAQQSGAQQSGKSIKPVENQAIEKPGKQLNATRRLATKLTHLPKRKVAIVLGLLGASSGLAFTQVAPSLQAALTEDPANAPLRRANDPAAESVLETQDLFLTNEIFYRKIEAIAKIPRNPAALGDPLQKGTVPSRTSSSPATATRSATEAAKAKAAAAQQAEQVKASAPPAPAPAPAPFLGTTIDSVLEMRVAVAKDVNAIALATSGKGTLTDLDGNILKSLSPETTALAEISGGIVVDGESMPSAFWLYPEDGGFVAVGSSWYRGRVLVALRDRGLIAVNYVLLGDYLYSVVGSEMSASWAIESLKAQAVAARSYALTHNIRPASEDYFDLDNTPRFQAYTGIAREASSTQAAVQATAGEFISHDGGIVESLYAASQAIVDDAHKGSGMSQLGARDLADQGYSYAEILGHYYPGTALGRLETNGE